MSSLRPDGALSQPPEGPPGPPRWGSVTLGACQSIRPRLRPTPRRPPSCASASRPSAGAARSSSCATATAASACSTSTDTGRSTIGRGTGNEVAWSGTPRSRACTPSSRVGGEWTVGDDGLSRNGSFVNGARISGRSACATATSCASARPRSPTAARVRGLDADRGRRQRLALPTCPPTQRQVLVALAGPTSTPIRDPGDQPGHRRRAAPQRRRGQVAPAHAVPALRDRAPAQNQKRSRLVAEALQSGVVSPRDL